MALAKKMIWYVLTIIFLIFGSFLFYFAYSDLKFKKDILTLVETGKYSKEITFTIASIFIVVAFIFIIDIFVHRQEKSEYVVVSNTGNISISQNALRSNTRSSVLKFSSVEMTKSKVTIKNDELTADVKADVYSDYNLNDLGKDIQFEIENGLRIMTGIDKIKVNLTLNREQKAHARDVK
ncbi:MAG: alkaline shock response membrane anchor protein AmaP [Peptoniphilaceae bacterium]|nr:alkaline shock response membrane anchor protein AmaP [Peptoniphilaceae bacterium]MDD7383250.1 alkaline shock response membrane anchor protein AmaP [Peptoniphilaceae bacterium]MDY3737993.1 alkaline shock response membrane anchor protein AmaP [Peptoniphilaceae bacterium]